VETQICLALLRLKVPINRDWTFFSQDSREPSFFKSYFAEIWILFSKHSNSLKWKCKSELCHRF